MKKVLGYTFAAAVLCCANVAVAGTATYTTTGGPEKTTGTDQYQGSYQEGTMVVTFADGTKVNEKWTCIGVSQPPNDKIFDLHFACDASSNAGSYSMIFGCDNIGDGGMHLNLVVAKDDPRSNDPAFEQELRQWIYARTVKDFGGSFSAEHALGRKNQFFYDLYTPAHMKKIHQLIKDILSPGPVGCIKFNSNI